MAKFDLIASVSGSYLTGTLEQNGAIFYVINNNHAFPPMRSQDVCYA